MRLATIGQTRWADEARGYTSKLDFLSHTSFSAPIDPMIFSAVICGGSYAVTTWQRHKLEAVYVASWRSRLTHFAICLCVLGLGLIAWSSADTYKRGFRLEHLGGYISGSILVMIFICKVVLKMAITIDMQADMVRTAWVSGSLWLVTPRSTVSNRLVTPVMVCPHRGLLSSVRHDRAPSLRASPRRGDYGTRWRLCPRWRWSRWTARRVAIAPSTSCPSSTTAMT